MKDLYADIIVDISQEKLDKTFQYRSQKRWNPGSKKERKSGFLSEREAERSPAMWWAVPEPKIEADRIKDILAVEEQGMEIESRLIALAAWIARNYGSTMNQALKTVLPVKEKRLPENGDISV